MPIEFKTNIDRVVEAMQEKSEKVISAMQLGLVCGVEQFQGQMIKDYFTGRPGLNTVSGTARNSWYILRSGSGIEYSAKLSNRPSAWYIAVHERLGFNGIVRRKSKYLTIPLNKDAVRMRQQYSDLRQAGKLFCQKSHNGNLILFMLTGKRGKLTPMFVLKDFVQIPRRLFIRDMWNNKAPKMILDQIVQNVDKAIA